MIKGFKKIPKVLNISLYIVTNEMEKLKNHFDIVKERTLKGLNKKGQMSGVGNKMNALIGAVIVIFLITALAPEIFTQIDALSASTETPSWVPTVMFVITGAGLVFLLYSTFNNR